MRESIVKTKNTKKMKEFNISSENILIPELDKNSYSNYFSSSAKSIEYEEAKVAAIEKRSKYRANSCTINLNVTTNTVLNSKIEQIKETFNRFKENTAKIAKRSVSTKPNDESLDKSYIDKSMNWGNYHYALGILSTVMKLKQKQTKLECFTLLKSFE